MANSGQSFRKFGRVGWEDPGVDVPVERVYQRLILGLIVRIEGGRPNCHSVNLLFDIHCVNIDIGSIVWLHQIVREFS